MATISESASGTTRTKERPLCAKAVDRQIWPQPSAIRGDYADR
jgi:hypothetical protein